jgi:hypothetical protein
MAGLPRVALAALLTTVLAVPASIASADPLEIALGSRWRVSLHGLNAPPERVGMVTWMGAVPAAHLGAWRAPGWHALAPQFAPASRLTVRFNGGAASLTLGPEAAGPLQPWGQRLPPAGEPADWQYDDEARRDPRLARHRLRQAVVGLLRSAGGSNDAPSTFEIGTSTSHHARPRLAAFPAGNGYSRALGLHQLSVRLTSSGDGHLVMGRQIGRHAFLTLEPGLGGTPGHARLQYRFAPWVEVRMQAGATRLVQLVAAIPLP